MPGVHTALPKGDSAGTFPGPQIIFAAWKFHNFPHVVTACLNYGISMRKCSCIISPCSQTTITIIRGKISRNGGLWLEGGQQLCAERTLRGGGLGPLSPTSARATVSRKHVQHWGWGRGCFGQVCERTAACSPWPSSRGLTGHRQTEGMNLRGAKPASSCQPGACLEQAGSWSLIGFLRLMGLWSLCSAPPPSRAAARAKRSRSHSSGPSRASDP